jgi:hypothetical protein
MGTNRCSECGVEIDGIRVVKGQRLRAGQGRGRAGGLVVNEAWPVRSAARNGNSASPVRSRLFIVRLLSRPRRGPTASPHLP